VAKPIFAMKIRELIENLKRYDQESMVLIDQPTGFDPLNTVVEGKLVQIDNKLSFVPTIYVDTAAPAPKNIKEPELLRKTARESGIAAVMLCLSVDCGHHSS